MWKAGAEQIPKLTVQASYVAGEVDPSAMATARYRDRPSVWTWLQTPNSAEDSEHPDKSR